MFIFKGVFLILGILFYIVTTFVLRILLLIVKSSLRYRIISYWTRGFNRFLVSLLNIKIIIEGNLDCLKENGNFIISNHLSYLDGVILGSLFPLIYVAKSEVKSWPMFGVMTQVGATIYIDRKRKEKSPDYIQETVAMLKKKVNVLVFPEGTSTNGEKLLVFQSVHFQSPLLSNSQILPVAISYTKINQEEANRNNRDSVFWYGQVKFHKHMLQVIKLKSIEVKVVIYPKIESAVIASSRKDLSELSYRTILDNYPLFKN